MGQRSATAPPLRKGGRADEFYESAQVGYIFNYTVYRGALFKGSWQVGAITTTCLKVTLFLRLSPFYSPFIKRGTRCGGDRLGGIKVISCRLGHRSRTNICAHSSHFGTHSGYPLCYEMPRSSLYKRGTRCGDAALFKGMSRNCVSLAKGRMGGRIL